MMLKTPLAILLLCLAGLHAHAQEDVIRKNLRDRLSDFPQIDEILKTPVPGIFEVRINNSQIVYVDEKANFLFEGILLNTQNKENLTATRIAKITAIEFKDLPFKDSFVIKKGTGKRKFAVFVDPNCGYCKQFEQDIQKMTDISMHVFLYPVLGADSGEKSSRIWCSKDKVASYEAYMNSRKPSDSAKCNTDSIDRNIIFGKKYNITGTPTIIFANGERVPGAMGVKKLEERLSKVASKI